MLILDTDHLTEIDRGMAAGARLVQRLDRAGEEVATTIVSAEEQLRGWLAQIGRLQDPYREIGLQAFARAACVLRSVECAALDARSGGDFLRLRGSGVRIGSMDLKIACIALSLGATLLTRNLKHFEKVTQLRAESWL
ncbi:MAG: type II toxin-antitoxin system VapC family toxin [Rhodomicrobium sp.]